MQKSEQINELSKALVDFQAEVPPAPMRNTNPFLRNRYADLGTIKETAKDLLKKYGLAVTQLTSMTPDGKLALTTMLMHESGQYVADTTTIPVEASKGMSAAQAAGSTITYMRRYALAAILGMYADEDVDGSEPVYEHVETGHRSNQPVQSSKPAAAKPVVEKETASSPAPVAAATVDARAKAATYTVPAGIPLAGNTLGQVELDPGFGKSVLQFLAGRGANKKGERFDVTANEKLAKAAAFLLDNPLPQAAEMPVS